MTVRCGNAGSPAGAVGVLLARMVVPASTPGAASCFAVSGRCSALAAFGLALALTLATTPTLSAAAAATAAAVEERGLPLIRNFSPRVFRGHNQIWTIAPASSGTWLFGQSGQIGEYDGLNWRNIEVPGGSFIRAVLTDRAGTTWVAGVNELGRLRVSDDGRFVYESLRRHVPESLGDFGAIWCLHEMPDGIWFQSNVALLRWANGRFDVWPMQETQTVLSYRFGDKLLVARPKGWFTPEPGGGWAQVGDDTLTFLPRFFFADPAGGWLIGTGSDGLRHFDGKQFTPRATEFDDWLKTKKLFRAERLPDGRIVFCSLQGGALIADANLRCETVLDENTGLLSDTVISAFSDRFGALWLGTDRGICRVDLGSPLTAFGPHHNLGRNGAETLRRIDGRTVVGGARGMMVLHPRRGPLARPQFQPMLEAAASDRFNQFLPLDGGVLAGGVTGLHWLSNGRSELIKNATGSSASGAREFVASQHFPQRYYIVHLNGVTWLERSDDQWRLGDNWPEPRGEVRSLIEDATGALWVATPNNGVLRLRVPADLAQPLAIERFADEAGLPAGRDRVWISRVGGAPLFHLKRGFFRFDDAARRFRPETRYGPAFSSGALSVRILTEDAEGGLWVAAEPTDETHLRVLYLRDGHAEPLALTDSDQIGSLNYLHWETRGGRESLWIGGQHALLHADLTAWRARPPSPLGATLLREAIARGDHRINPSASTAPRLPARENALRFTFGTPGLAGEPDVQHETRLRGFADGGEIVSAAGERTFTNLPAGDYVFEVRGRSADGRWSTPAHFAFSILAPWWQTPWAWTGYALTLAGLTSVIVRRRTRGLERERARLESVVFARTAELAQKNLELERLNRLEQDEKLTARLAEEKARLELLRYQLNPHFLFNSLNSIRALVFAHPEAAGEMVTRLAEFCRWTLMRGSGETTTVAEEAEMVRTYLDIEKARWMDALVTSVEIDDAVRHERLPQFLLLPLIENAIKYGGRTSESRLEVGVSVRADHEHLACEVANTGTWIEPTETPSPTSTHIGLENLRQRLARHYGPACALQIVHGDGWVRMRLRLKRGLPLVPIKRTSHDPFTKPE